MTVSRVVHRWRSAALLLVAASLVVAGCRPFGAGVPICGDLEVAETSGGDVRATLTGSSGEVHSLRSSHLIQLQAAPQAEWGVCIDELPRGWDLLQPEPRSGEVPLQFLAGDLGGLFLRVALTDGCEPPPSARRIQLPHGSIERWVAVHDRSHGIAVTVVPVAARHEQHAYELATDLRARELRGSELSVRLSNVVDGPADERIADQLEDGAAVLVVDDDYTLRDTLELRVPEAQDPISASYGSILTELAERTEPPRYVATWWDVGPGGCTVFEFDAEGPAASTLEADVEQALGRFPLGELRRGLAAHGYVIDPPT